MKFTRCFQCSKRLKPGRKNFCDSVCRHAYDLKTWGDGRPKNPDEQPLTNKLETSLLAVRVQLSLERFKKPLKKFKSRQEQLNHHFNENALAKTHKKH